MKTDSNQRAKVLG